MKKITLLSLFIFTSLILVATPSWMGNQTYNQSTSSQDVTFSVWQNGDYSGLHCKVGVSINGGSTWTKYTMNYSGNTSGNSVWSVTQKISSLIKSHQSSNPLKAPAANSKDRQRVRLEVSNETATDEALVYFDADAANDYDDYDSPKMPNNIATIPEIYTQVNGQKLVINGMNSISNDMEIPLGFTTGQSNTFTIKATQLSNIPSDTKVYLKDNTQLNPLTELALNQDYTFTSDVTTDNTSRFSLVFKAPSVTTATNLVKNQLVRVFSNENNQIVIERNSQPNNSTAYIYNTVGQLVQQLHLNSTITTSGVSYPCGTYFITIRGNDKQTTTKLLINNI